MGRNANCALNPNITVIHANPLNSSGCNKAAKQRHPKEHTQPPLRETERVYPNNIKQILS